MFSTRQLESKINIKVEDSSASDQLAYPHKLNLHVYFLNMHSVLP